MNMELPSEIPVLFEGTQKWITGITPKTTCDDVIHSLLINVGCPIPHEAVRSYALFENWRGIERPLKGRSRFMKLWRDWGDESQNVEITMRKVDSSVKDDAMYGTLKRKNRIKDWFKTKDKKKDRVSKSMHNIHQDMHNIHDDSSIMAQNKDNMFCAFSCYKKKRGGLRERNTNIQTPFERPRSVAVVQPHSMAIQNPMYHDTYTPQDSMMPLTKHYSVSQISHYGSRTSLKQTYVTKRRTYYGEDEEEPEPIYATAKEPFFPVEHYYEKPTPKERKRMPQNIHDWDYDYNRQTPYDSESGADSEPEHDRGSMRADYNDTRFKSLLNLVLSQERRIQEQFSRLKDADKQIESYELAMHKLRSVKQGKDYLQDTYMSSGDRTLTEEGIQKIDELGNMCDKVTEMDDQLRERYQQLHDLSLQLETEAKQLEESIRDEHQDGNNTTQAEGPFESTRLSPKPSEPSVDPEFHSQVNALRSDLHRSLSMSVAQQGEIKALDRHMYQYQSEMKHKQEQLSKLVSELNVPSDYQTSHESAYQAPQMYSSVNQASAISSVSKTHAPRALTRQLKSLGDLQAPVNRPIFQPGMRKSISDLRETLQTQNPANTLERHMRNYREMQHMGQTMRTLINSESDYHTSSIAANEYQTATVSKSRRRALLPMPPLEPETQGFAEMGIDVGSHEQQRTKYQMKNETDDLKHRQQTDPNSEVQKILSSRTPVLTPIKEQDFTHTVIEYHNETVDLDALYKMGRFQNPSKMFNEKDSFKPIQNPESSSQCEFTRAKSESDGKYDEPLVKLIYDAEAKVNCISPNDDVNEQTPTNVSKTVSHDVSVPSDANKSAFLPPPGLETMSYMKGRKFMPSILDDTTKDSETAFEITDTASPQLLSESAQSYSNKGLSEDTSVWGSPCASDNAGKTEVLHKTELQNNTSIWNTQDNAPDGTFTLAAPTQNVLPIKDTNSGSDSQPGELTLCGEANVTNCTDSSESFKSLEAASTDIIRQTIALSLSGKSPNNKESPTILFSVKKRLFSDIDDAAKDNDLEVTPEVQTSSQSILASLKDNMASPDMKLPSIAISEMTKIDSTLSPLSMTTDSTESGVCSMPSEDLMDDSDLEKSDDWSTNSFTETSV